MRPFGLSTALLLAGCVIREPGDSATDSDAGTTTDEPAATDAGETEGETLGELPAECTPPEPPTSAAFAFALADPDSVSNSWQIDAPCVIDGVTVEGAAVVTALTCTIDDAPVAATLTIPVAPEGEVDWAPSAPVRVIAVSPADQEVDDASVRSRVELRTADSKTLLVAAVWHEYLEPSWFAPLSVEVVQACGAEAFDIVRSMRIDVSAPEVAPVGVFSGGRAALPVDGGRAYAIDVEEATAGNCCHHDRWHHLVVRRVVVGG